MKKEMKKSPKIYKETEIPSEYEFYSKGEGPLKLLTKFEALNQKDEYIPVQEIESGLYKIFFRGTLLPPPGKKLPEIFVQLSQTTTYQFDYSRELKGIWIQTSPGTDGVVHYYRLMEVHKAYEQVYKEIFTAGKIWIFVNPFLTEKKNKELTMPEFIDFCVENKICTKEEFQNSKFLVKGWMDGFARDNNLKYTAKKLVAGFNYHYKESDGCHLCESVKPLEYVACKNWNLCGNQICFGCSIEHGYPWDGMISSTTEFYCKECKN